MKTIELTVKITLEDDHIWYDESCPEETEWFTEELWSANKLFLPEVGDDIEVEVTSVNMDYED